MSKQRPKPRPDAKPRPPRKRAGPRLGKFSRKLVRIPRDVFERDIASIRAALDPDFPDGIAIALAEVARTYTASLVAAQLLPSAREIAVALGGIRAWAEIADPSAAPPWADLPMVPTIVEADTSRAALTLVGVEARSLDRDPSRENFARLANAAARVADALSEIARKRGASGPPGAARHAETAAMVLAVATEFHERGIPTPLRHPDEWQLDWSDRPVFAAVRAVLSVAESHLDALGEVAPAQARIARLTLRAARDAPYTLINVVRAANPRRKTDQ